MKGIRVLQNAGKVFLAHTTQGCLHFFFKLSRSSPCRTATPLSAIFNTSEEMAKLFRNRSNRCEKWISCMTGLSKCHFRHCCLVLSSQEKNNTVSDTPLIVQALFYSLCPLPPSLFLLFTFLAHRLQIWHHWPSPCLVSELSTRL